MTYLFRRKSQIKYDLDSLKTAAELITNGTVIDDTSYYELKNGVTYYVIEPGPPEGEEQVPKAEKDSRPYPLPGIKRHYAFVRLSDAKTNHGDKFNIYNDYGNLISKQVGVEQAWGWRDEITEYIIPSRCLFYNADELLSSQGGGNKRKKHSSNKLSKRRVKTKSRRRNNISHRRKQQR